MGVLFLSEVLRLDDKTSKRRIAPNFHKQPFRPN
jgi:hypothetical protein